MKTLFFLEVFSTNNIGITLLTALMQLFDSHPSGILTASNKFASVFRCEDKYYFTDSHTCGLKGKPTAESGRACVIQCDNLQELCHICKRCIGSRNIAYTLIRVDVNFRKDIIIHQALQEQQQLLNPTSVTVPMQTTVMLPIDNAQPHIENVLEVSGNVNEIRRKTNDNIGNEAHEIKAEEFAWYQLFPYGTNGLKEQRPSLGATVYEKNASKPGETLKFSEGQNPIIDLVTYLFKDRNIRQNYNNRNIRQYGFKKAINKDNYNLIELRLHECQQYIKSLLLSTTKQSVLNSRKLKKPVLVFNQPQNIDHDFHLEYPLLITIYKNEVITYIAGYILSKLLKNLHCSICLKSLIHEHPEKGVNNNLIKLKNVNESSHQWTPTISNNSVTLI
ncbi:hypothetical protein ABEB36_009292 [Hypothenemus hampei]|uniref:Uncharacterized protein n=1 Tax=Hypothenemus hampei TaxID=57062 RepID=A0ABD1EGE8_HYPHA